jgi:hypothetical protein
VRRRSGRMRQRIERIPFTASPANLRRADDLPLIWRVLPRALVSFGDVSRAHPFAGPVADVVEGVEQERSGQREEGMHNQYP